MPIRWIVPLLICMPLSAAEWVQVDQASRLTYEARFENAPVPGVFRTFATEMRFDPENTEDARMDVTVDLRAADMDSADINEAIAGEEWFFVSSYPNARFFSDRIETLEDGRFRAVGKLSLKGLERELAVPFTWQANDQGARVFGEVMVWRSDFNIGGGDWADGNVIGLDIQVRFDVQLREKP